jgi:hypothetical protein
MTRKHYIAIAAKFKAEYESALRKCGCSGEQGMFFEGQAAGVRLAVEAFASLAAQDNPRFDRTRFLNACGVGS